MVKYRWYKSLSHADAQHPEGVNTNPTGHLTLVQAKHPIDSATWFRDILFGGLPWGGSSDKERISLRFAVVIRGRSMGQHVLEISHTPSFEAKQGNRATVLHWGVISHLVHTVDYSGNVVTIERDLHDNFTLTIDSGPTGPFKE